MYLRRIIIATLALAALTTTLVVKHGHKELPVIAEDEPDGHEHAWNTPEAYLPAI